MIKSIALLLGLVGSLSLFSANAEAQHRDRDDTIIIDGEIEFQIGDTTIKIGSDKRYDGRDHRNLEDRIRRLERAVRFLLENEGYNGHHRRTEWECSLETPFDGVFYARGDTETQARIRVVDDCNRKTNEGLWCKSDRAKCSEIK